MAYTSEQISEKGYSDKSFKFYKFNGSMSDRRKFLMEKNRMQDEYLGAGLDHIRGGFMNACGWNCSTKGLMDFILHWINLNQGNLIWSDQPVPDKLQLPYRKFDKCPRDEKHKGTVRDMAGRTRCAHFKDKFARPSLIEEIGPYLDDYAQTKILQIYEKEPHDPTHIDDDDDMIRSSKEWAEYQKELGFTINEDKTARIIEPCYAILKEPNFVMPLETLIDRLNINPRKIQVYCRDRFDGCSRISEIPKNQRSFFENFPCLGHIDENPNVTMPFCGWTLAWYVQKWYEQVKDGKAPVYRKPREIDTFKPFGDFQVMSSED